MGSMYVCSGYVQLVMERLFEEVISEVMHTDFPQYVPTYRKFLTIPLIYLLK